MNIRMLSKTLIACAMVQCTTLLAQDSTEEPKPEPNLVNSGAQLFGGLGVPLGDFSESDNGGANTGFVVGGQYTISLGDGGEFFRNSGIALGVTYANNGIDIGMLSGLGLSVESGSYSNIWVLGGLKTTFPASEAVSIDLTVLLGAVFSSSPELTASGSGALITVSSASATAFALSAGGDVVLSKHFTFGLRYYAAEPEYSIRFEGTGPGASLSTTEDVEQSTSILAVSVGYIF